MTTQPIARSERRMRLKLERRIEQPRWLSISTAPILIVAALLVGALLLRLAGANPWAVYRSMVQIAFGGAYGWSDTTIKATPLILAALGVSLAFRDDDCCGDWWSDLGHDSRAAQSKAECQRDHRFIDAQLCGCAVE